jgi:hypothetical protein
MSPSTCDTPRPFQPPITQRDIEAEVAQCVGGVRSPLLCNVYLHRLDRAWDTGKHGVLVRYRDGKVRVWLRRVVAVFDEVWSTPMG